MKRKLTCTNYFIILEKRFSREHTKNLNANVWARPDGTFWAVGYHPPESKLAFHIILCKICEHAYVQNDQLGKYFFLFPICIIQ